MAAPDGHGKLEGFQDFRSGKRGTAVFCPVGDVAQLDAFVSHMRLLGIGELADFVLILRKGLKCGKIGLSHLRCFEAKPLGTSGCFAAGQRLCYELGYEVIVSADLDAFLDSRSTFEALLRTAKEGGKACVPLSKPSREAKADPSYFVINQWGAVSRQAIGKVGLMIGHTYRGGEDWEYAHRLMHYGLLAVYRDGFAVHPRHGFSIYEKLASPKKYYPYVTGLMRAFLSASQYDKGALARYVAWHSYYCFFADAFSDRELARAVDESAQEGVPMECNAVPKVALEGSVEGAGAMRRLAALPLQLASLAVHKSADVPGGTVRLCMGRLPLAAGIAKAVLLSPLRLVQGIWRALFGKRGRGSE